MADESRIQQLRVGIREGEMRLMDKKQTGKEAIRRAISNNQVRIQRLEAGLPEGGMVYQNGMWEYEFSTFKCDCKRCAA